MAAPYELTLYSFLDAQGEELHPTMTDERMARLYARRHKLTLLRNHYEFVTSEPAADFTRPREGVRIP